MNLLKVLTGSRIKGHRGEKVALKHLKKKGYKIAERNYVALDTEIDIIAKKDDMTVFVEVKTRTVGHSPKGEPRPASSVTPEKQRGIIKAAKAYLTPNFINGRVRFDVIEVLLSDESKPRVEAINHMENTFNRDTAFKRRY